ncbi:ABC transporter permease [Geminicoccaceae bacterium 1502E]|nr:ABC transporter permease [Geminicoccaceae bacterium 1502E]
MREWLTHVWRLGIKELHSLRRDPVLVLLIVYVFTLAIHSVATGVKTEVVNAAIAVVDEDRSALSRQIRDAFRPPLFQTPVLLAPQQVDEAMDHGRQTFVLDIPPRFEADLLAGRGPDLQLAVDATAMTQAGIGATYVETIVMAEIATFLGGSGAAAAPVATVVRARFNPNLDSTWFTAVMQVINNVTILAIVLVGAAVMREREHGTIEHLLVMPLRASEIMAAKIWANGLVILAAAILSLWLVVNGLLGVPIVGSTALFALGTGVYLVSVTALGILLSTLARSMPQFGLLAIPVFAVMNMLSGATTPLESMPAALRLLVQPMPSTQFVAFAQAVLYRGAGLETVWPQLAAMAAIGAAFFVLALARFRAALAAAA